VAALSIAEQDRRIRAAWPTFRTIIAGKRLGIWRGTLRGLSHPYEIEIVYARNRSGDPFVQRTLPAPTATDDEAPAISPVRHRRRELLGGVSAEALQAALEAGGGGSSPAELDRSARGELHFSVAA